MRTPTGRDPRRIRRFVRISAAGRAALAALCLAAAAALANADDWSPQVRPLLEALRAGAAADVPQGARAYIDGSQDARVVQDASALAALALHYAPERNARQDGEAWLLQLAERDPELLRRGDSLLALGHARLMANEVPAALAILADAADAFERAAEPAPLAQAWLKLAQAWSVCHDWEALPARFGISRPASAESAQAIREAQLAELRKKLSKHAQASSLLPQLDLLRARMLLAADENSAEGRALLEQLASQPLEIAAVAEATLRLAELDEAQRRFADALRRYEALARGSGELADTAQQRSVALRRPQLQLDSPAVIRPDQAFSPRLRARNLRQVRVELRRVDLSEWLGTQQGRLIEAQLPISGSLLLTHEILPDAAEPLEWIECGAATALREPLPAGAYVLSAEGTALGGGETVQLRKLLLCTVLEVVMIAGPTRATIWLPQSQSEQAEPPSTTLPASVTQATSAPATARFWMHGSYVPTTVELREPLAQFELPPESRLFADRRWTCLIEHAGQIALCRGTLPSAIDAALGSGQAAMIGAPRVLSAGETFSVFGALLDTAAESIDLLLLDAVDRQIQTRRVPVTAAGTFAATFAIEPAMAGQTYRVVARLGSQALANWRGRLTLSVLGHTDPPFALWPELPAWIRPDGPPMLGTLRAGYVWGTPSPSALYVVNARSVPLPRSGPRSEWPAPTRYALRVRFAQPQAAAVQIGRAELALDERPTAIGLWINARLPDGREKEAFADAISGPQPLHAWLQHAPAQPRVGQPLRFFAGWFDPQRSLAGDSPRLRITRDGRALPAPRLAPSTEGLESEAWTAPQAGEYQVVFELDGAPRATLALNVDQADAPPETVRLRDALALPAATGASDPAAPHTAALQLDGRIEAPTLALLLDSETRAAAVVPPGAAGQITLSVPTAGRLTNAAGARQATDAPGTLQFTSAPPAGRAALLQVRDGQVQVVAQRAVRGELAAPSVARVDDRTLSPGQTIRMRVGGLQRGATVLARLVAAQAGGEVTWLPGRARPDLQTGGLPIVSSSGASESIPGGEPDISRTTALFEGEPQWIGSVAANADTLDIDVPLPNTPGVFRLLISHWSRLGVSPVRSLTLDTRRGLHAAASAPRACYVGDRVLAALELTNPSDEPITAQVTIERAQGVSVERLEAAGKAADSAALAVLIAPRTTLPVRALFEAAAVGSAELVFAIASGAASQSHRISIDVRDAGPSPSAKPPSWKFLRSVLALERAHASDNPFDDPRGARYDRVLLAAGDRVPPNQPILVRYEFELDQPARDVTFTQRLPATCHTVLNETGQPQSLPGRFTRQLDQIEWTFPKLDRGKHTHEFVMIAVRPGACLLPAPTVHAGENTIPVLVEPEDFRLGVAEAR